MSHTIGASAMQARVSLPMYLATPGQVEAFWEHLRGLLADMGLQRLPLHMSWPPELPSHWLQHRYQHLLKLRSWKHC